MTANDIYLEAAAHLNDVSGSLFSFASVLPFLQIAFRDLEAQLLVNDIQLLEQVTAEQTIAALGTALTSAPSDMVVPEKMLERVVGSTNPEDFVLMYRRNILPKRQQATTLIDWAFRNNAIEFVGATTARRVILYYKRLMTNVSATNSAVTFLQAQNYLGYRTAALASERLGEDTNRADRLNMDADKSMELLLATCVKDNQAFPTRRRRYSDKFKSRYNRTY